MRALISRVIDLTGATLDKICLGFADLRGVIFDDCSLKGAWLKGADLENASLKGCNLSPSDSCRESRLLGANLLGADLSGSDMTSADLSFCNLNDAQLCQARLDGVDLTHASLVRTNIAGARLTGARVYGTSTWDVKGVPAAQRDLVITPPASLGAKSYYYVLAESADGKIDREGEPAPNLPVSSPVTVDRLEVAQFVYLLLRNTSIRDVIDTIGQKGVLILGRFSADRKAVLEMIRCRLRELGWVPMMFDFERPTSRDFTETIRILASISRFVIADITNPKSSPLELQAVVPDYAVPLVPILQKGETPFSMFVDLQNRYPWVLDVLVYDSPEQLSAALASAVVASAVKRSKKLAAIRAKPLRSIHLKDLE